MSLAPARKRRGCTRNSGDRPDRTGELTALVSPRAPDPIRSHAGWRARKVRKIMKTATRPGPVGVDGHPDPLSLLADKDPALAANKRLVFDMWRSIVNAGHVELADDMLQEGYVQHSPLLPTGRIAFKAIFSAVERREIPEMVAPPLVSIIAEGALVVMALAEA